MSGLGAAQRVQRLLALIPWLREHRPGGATIAEVSDRFDYPATDLVSDLTDVVNFVSADRYQHFLSFDVVVTEDQRSVQNSGVGGEGGEIGWAPVRVPRMGVYPEREWYGRTDRRAEPDLSSRPYVHPYPSVPVEQDADLAGPGVSD